MGKKKGWGGKGRWGGRLYTCGVGAGAAGFRIGVGVVERVGGGGGKGGEVLRKGANNKIREPWGGKRVRKNVEEV